MVRTGRSEKREVKEKNEKNWGRYLVKIVQMIGRDVF